VQGSERGTGGSERGTGASSSSEDQWWLPLSDRVAAKNGSASNQVAADQAVSSVVQTAPRQQTVPSERPRGSSIGLAMLAVLAAAAGAGLTSWWLASQRSVPLQIEPQTVAVGEVTAPQTPSPSLNDMPLPQPVPKSIGVASTAPAVKDAQRPASARRPRTEPTAAAPSTEVASASSSSAAPDVPAALVEPHAPPPVQAPAAPEAPASPHAPFFSSTDVTEPPQVATRVEPRLPDELVNSPVNDVVVVRLLVSQTGHPFRISFLRRSKAGAPLDDAVIAAVSRWTFSPARKKGEAVSCWLNVGVPIKSNSVEASTASVATLGEPHTADQAHHTSRARQ
jgi:periplasmic protein TonB